MNILIPIDKDKKLCSLKENSSWSVATLDEGKTKDILFYSSQDEIQEMIDYIVVRSKDEPTDDFYFEGVGVLIAPVQQTIEDIIEAYMFRELHELNS